MGNEHDDFDNLLRTLQCNDVDDLLPCALRHAVLDLQS